MNTLNLSDNKLSRTYAEKNIHKEEFFHSSSYGVAQNSGNIGVSSGGMTMNERKAIEEKRKYVQKYSSSELLRASQNLSRPKTHTRIFKRDSGAFTGSDRHGRERLSDARVTSERSQGDVIGIGGKCADNVKPGAGLAPHKASVAPTPSPAARFSANIKPTFK